MCSSCVALSEPKIYYSRKVYFQELKEEETWVLLSDTLIQINYTQFKVNSVVRTRNVLHYYLQNHDAIFDNKDLILYDKNHKEVFRVVNLKPYGVIKGSLYASRH
jgi:hypothetical protein